MRGIIHLDMDAFFAAVEQRDHPAYLGKPVIVGGSPDARGVVSTCSYEARKYGVRSAMPLREAGRRCPHGIFLPVRMKRYQEVSRELMAILHDYTPLVEPISIDEAFLDVTGSEKLFGPAEKIAREILNRVESELGLTASVGIACNKFLAKVASDLQKPRGFVVVDCDKVEAFLAPLAVGRLWGVGPKTLEILSELGIKKIGDLQSTSVEQLRRRLGENTAKSLHRLAFGEDERPVATEREAKSIGHEVTFSQDTADQSFLEGVLLELCEKVARRLRKNALIARIITLKLRDSEFKTVTRRITLTSPTDLEEIFFQNARHLFAQVKWAEKPLRLVGVCLSGLEGKENEQGRLFAGEEEELRRLHHTVDELRDRFGETAVTRGRLLHHRREHEENKENKKESAREEGTRG